MKNSCPADKLMIYLICFEQLILLLLDQVCELRFVLIETIFHRNMRTYFIIETRKTTSFIVKSFDKFLDKTTILRVLQVITEWFLQESHPIDGWLNDVVQG